MEKISLEAKYFSQHFNVSLKGDETWFDTRLDRDTQLYIDPFLVFKSNIPEFKDTRKKFNVFFEVAIEMIFKGATNSNSLEKLENNVLYFREAGEIQLGDSTSCKPGNGPGRKFSKSCVSALELLIHKPHPSWNL